MDAIGNATWQGTWKEGSGTLSTSSDTIANKPYSFSSRFEGTPGASPEELLSVALAGCFNQALANNFGMIGLTSESISTSVLIDLGYGDNGHPSIKSAFITTDAKCPGIKKEQFDHCVERARTNCTVAVVLKLDPGITASLLA